MECEHNLNELMYNDNGYYIFLGLYYCLKCKGIFKKELREIKYQ